MKCPWDSTRLDPRLLRGVAVDVCPQCDGIWLDEGDLVWLGVDVTVEGLREPRESPYACPACGVPMAEGEHLEAEGLELATCSTCHGIWLQSSQLGLLLAPELEEAPAPTSDPLRAGRFEVLHELFRGRFTTLQRAFDRVRNGEVLLLRLEETPDQPALQGQFRGQVYREGHLLSRLEHRNLPKVLEIVECGSVLFLVLEDFEGQPLSQFSGAEPALLRRILEQLISVLDYLHGQKPPIVHRDLRPETVLMTPFGVLKLVEFGLARMREEGDSATLFRAQGDRRYAPPEQLTGAPSHPGNDWYAVGALLFHLATGEDPPDSVRRIKKPVRIRELALQFRPDLPADLATLLEELMEPDLRSRLCSGEEVRRRELELSPGGEAPQVLPRFLAREPGESGKALAAARQLAMSMVGRLSSWQLLFGSRSEAPSQPQAAPEAESPVVLPPARVGEFDLRAHDLSREVARMLPERVADFVRGLLVSREGGELLVAVEDPGRPGAVDHVTHAVGGRAPVRLVSADPRDLELARRFVYRPWEVDRPWKEWLARELGETPAPVRREGSPGDRLLEDAWQQGATHVHLEPGEPGWRVRFRVDGSLVERPPLPEGAPLAAAFQDLAGLDPRRAGIPRTGSFHWPDRCAVGLSVLPTAGGDSLVLELRREAPPPLPLDELGLQPADLDLLRVHLAFGSGLVLVGGPPRSGRATTLRSCLAEVARPERRLLALDAPGALPHVTNLAIPRGLSTASVLREALHHDPDVLSLGEFRDLETARLALTAAADGVLVLAPVRARSAVGLPGVLGHLGLEPHEVASALSLGLVQRLARRLCEHCREELPELPRDAGDRMRGYRIAPPRAFRAAGCPECRWTGTRGRVALFEVLAPGPDMRRLAAGGAPLLDLEAAARDEGLRPLVVDGLRKVADGLVSLEELHRLRSPLS